MARQRHAWLRILPVRRQSALRWSIRLGQEAGIRDLHLDRWPQIRGLVAQGQAARIRKLHEQGDGRKERRLGERKADKVAQ